MAAGECSRFLPLNSKHKSLIKIMGKPLILYLVEALKKEGIKEIIIATNPTMEGEATAMYLLKKLKAKSPKLKVSRLGMGVPTGADLEYADETTLIQAIQGRREL